MAAAAAAAAATAASWTILSGAGFIDRDRSAVDLFEIQVFYGGLGLATVRHFNKGESTRTSCFPILNDAHRRYRSKRLKGGPYVVLRRVKRQISHVNVGHNNPLCAAKQ